MFNYAGKLKDFYTKDSWTNRETWEVYQQKFLFITTEWESLKLWVDKDFNLDDKKLKVGEEYIFPVRIFLRSWIKDWKAWAFNNFVLAKNEEILSV